MKLNEITDRKYTFIDYLNKNNLTDIGVEVGVRYARNAINILKQWHGNMLFLVDSWENILDKEEAINRIQQQINYSKEGYSNYEIIHEYSTQAAKRFENESLSFCYIDANHSYEHVKQDIEAWYYKVKKGGLLCGHDYGVNEELWIKETGRAGWPHSGVKKAVDDFVDQHNLELHIDQQIGINPTSWYIKIS